MTIKSTYALDIATVRTLERIARRWKVSKSEALRRAIRAAGDREAAGGSERLEVLDELQRSMNLSPARAGEWARKTRSERQASSTHSESRGG